MNEENSKQDSKIKSTIDAAIGLVKAVPVYEDTVQPSAKQIGKSLETVAKTINIALAPIKALVWGYEQIEQFVTTRVAEKMKNVKQENIITPPPQVAGPAIEALRFSGHDENLRELFANLLATSMDKDTIEKAHPGYVEIIKNLSSDEALLLNAFVEKSSFPVINVRLDYEGDKGHNIVLANYSHLHKIVAIKSPDLTPSYLDNLCRLGILEIPSGIHFSAEDIYERLENDEHIKLYRKVIEEREHKISFNRRLVQLTTFGKQFVDNIVVGKK